MKTTKEVTILARYAHKTNGKLNGTVTYLVKSSDGTTKYCTTLIEGKASGCSCPAHKPCYHMKGLEKKEAARTFAAKQLPEWAIKLVNTGTIVPPAMKQPVKKTPDMMKAALTTNKGFSLLR
jgi:hypothetical protein